MKIKLIIFAVIVLAILTLSYFLYFKKPSTGSVVPATTVKQSPTSSNGGSNSASSNTGINATPPTQTGTPSAVANQNNVAVYGNDNIMKYRVNKGGYVGIITGVNGNVTHVNFSSTDGGGSGWVTTTQVDTKYF